jgi:uncharacterized membrane protein (DUF485 family)
MKIEVREYSENAWSEALSLTTLAWYFAQIICVGFVAMKLGHRIGANDAQALICAVVAVIGYLAYVIAKMAAVDVATANGRVEDAEAKANAVMDQAEKSERYVEAMQALKEKAQSLMAEKQSLMLKVQTLGENFRSATDRNVELAQSLDGERANAKRALASYEAIALETAQATLLAHNKALQIAKNEGLQWKGKYEGLSRDVARANAEKELQSLERTITARKSSMTGRVWTDEKKAEEQADKDRIEKLKALLA